MTRGINRSAATRVATSMAMVAGVIFVAASPASACSGASFSSVYLTGHQTVVPLYYTQEGVAKTFRVVGSIDEGSFGVGYDTPPGFPLSATPDVDYTPQQGRFSWTNPPGGTNCLGIDGSDTVPVADDGVIDAGGVEEVTVQLEAPSSGLQITRGSVPLYILDKQGSIRARFPEPTLFSQTEPLNSSSNSVVKVPVLRGGTGSGAIGFQISGATSDITSPTSGNVEFTGGLGFIEVRIAHDTVDDPGETVTITISGSSGASVEGDNTFTLTIIDNDSGGGGDTQAPVAKFHHPKHNETYGFSSFQADTIHLFVFERPQHQPNLISQAQVALRKNLRNGNCRWWLSGSWRAEPCAETQWITVNNHVPNYVPGVKDLFIYEAYPTLRPSVGTRIRNYTVLGRAFDTSGNESSRQVGNNVNTFEVNRP